MRKLYILLIITALANVCFGQMKQKEIEAIKNDTTLYYGLGHMCNSSEEAMESAKTELYANIAKKCNTNAIFIPGNGDKQLETIIRTFKEKINEKKDEYVVAEDEDKEEFIYLITLKRSDFREMCKNRKNDIRNNLCKAVRMEDEASFEDALKLYYWSLMLWYAHPQGEKMRIDIEDIKDPNRAILYKGVDYKWIVDRIDGGEGILKSFNFNVLKENGIQEAPDGVIVNLLVKRNDGSKVANMSCEYYDGKKYQPNTVRDGKLIVHLRNKDTKNFKIKINYDFKEDAKKMGSEVYNAIELIKAPRFSSNVYTVDLEKVKSATQDKDKDKEKQEHSWDKVEHNRAVTDHKNIYLEKIKRIENALRTNNLNDARDCFSKEGYNMIDTLAHYGKMTVVGVPNYRFMKYNDEVICRSITLQFDFRNTPGFSQDVVFRFDTINKVVTSIAFRLSDRAESDIISKTKWPEDSRMLLINFLEDYQTAYALKRHKYLESIYSDDALIIVGRLVERTVIKDRMTLNLTDKEVQLTKYDKDTYMKNLSMCFKNNEYIRLRFTETDFTKASNRNEVYGVRVRQEYFSSSYGDVGYLFLLVDLRGKQPLIHVRAWQPDKVDLDKLMSVGDVRFN